MRKLLEDIQGIFEPDLANVVTEDAKPGSVSVTRYPGRLSRCGEVNGNNRRYSRKVWENQVKEGSHLRQLMSRGAAFGLLEHPADGKISLASPISHALTDVTLRDDGEVHGTLTVLETAEGRKLRALIAGGYKPTVSSRGFGSLLRNSDGIDDVQEDFICEGWDVVFTPSFKDAELTVESVDDPSATPPTPPTPSEETEPTPPKPTATPVTESKVPDQKQQTHTMDKTAIISRLATFESLNPASMDASRFASSMQQLNALHEDVASYAAEDAKRSWEAQQLHAKISQLESSWSSSIAKPAEELRRVSENTTKLKSVLKSVVETGLSYKSKLVEARKTTASTKTLVEDVAKRGRSWKTLAEKQTEKVRTLEKRYGIACEMLDALAAQYKTDNTALGRRVLELEFPDEVKKPEIAEALATAKKPKDIAAIRESITKTGKETGKAPAPVAESDKGAAAPKPEAAPISETVQVITPSRGKPGSVTESIALAKRLSASMQAA